MCYCFIFKKVFLFILKTNIFKIQEGKKILVHEGTYGKLPPQPPIFLYLFRKMLYSWGAEISTLNLEFKWFTEVCLPSIVRERLCIQIETLHREQRKDRFFFFFLNIKYQINLLEYNKQFKLGTQTNLFWELFVWCDPSAVEFVEKKSSVALTLPSFRTVEKDLWNDLKWL